jgi:hypothetical protein
MPTRETDPRPGRMGGSPVYEPMGRGAVPTGPRQAPDVVPRVIPTRGDEGPYRRGPFAPPPGRGMDPRGPRDYGDPRMVSSYGQPDAIQPMRQRPTMANYGPQQGMQTSGMDMQRPQLGNRAQIQPSYPTQPTRRENAYAASPDGMRPNPGMKPPPRGF